MVLHILPSLLERRPAEKVIYLSLVAAEFPGQRCRDLVTDLHLPGRAIAFVGFPPPPVAERDFVLECPIQVEPRREATDAA